MMLSRDDCVLKTSGNFKITSLVARYSLGRPSSANHLISPLGIAPLLQNLIIITSPMRRCCTMKYSYTHIFSIDPGHFFLIIHTGDEGPGQCPAPPDCCCHYEQRSGAGPANPGLISLRPEAGARGLREDNGEMESQD